MGSWGEALFVGAQIPRHCGGAETGGCWAAVDGLSSVGGGGKCGRDEHQRTRLPPKTPHSKWAKTFKPTKAKKNGGKELPPLV